MKLVSFVAAGLVTVAGMAPVAIAAPASAQRTVVVHKTVVRHRGPVVRHRARRICTNVWRNHRKIRRCRTVYR